MTASVPIGVPSRSPIGVKSRSRCRYVRTNGRTDVEVTPDSYKSSRSDTCARVRNFHRICQPSCLPDREAMTDDDLTHLDTCTRCGGRPAPEPHITQVCDHPRGICIEGDRT